MKITLKEKGGWGGEIMFSVHIGGPSECSTVINLSHQVLIVFIFCNTSIRFPLLHRCLSSLCTFPPSKYNYISVMVAFDDSAIQIV